MPESDAPAPSAPSAEHPAFDPSARVRDRLEGGGLAAALSEQLQAAPWYAGSIAVHLFLFMILMLLPSPPPKTPPAPVVIEVHEVVEEEELAPPEPELPDTVLEYGEITPTDPVDAPEFKFDDLAFDTSVDDAPLADNDAFEETLDPLDFVSSDVLAVSVPSTALSAGGRPSSFGLRTGNKGRRIRRFGGKKTLEPATVAALEFLKAHQPETGLYGRHCDWCSDGHGPAPAADPAYHASATALAALAFMGFGSSPDKGPYRVQANRAIEALLAIQNSNGEFHVAKRSVEGCPTARPYAHAAVLWAVAEAQWMAPKRKYAEAVRRGVAFALSRQREDGGWFDAHTPNPTSSDTHTTGWYVMALLQARDAGATVPSQVLVKARRYLEEAAWRPDRTSGSHLAQFVSGSADNYKRTAGDWTMDSVGLVCLQFLGVPRSASKVRTLGKTIADQLASGKLSTMEGRSLNFFGQYFASMGLFQFGADRREPSEYAAAWAVGNRHIVSLIPDTQEKRGTAKERKGSWEPMRESAHGPFGARVGLTAAGALIMQVFYRYDIVGGRGGPDD